MALRSGGRKLSFDVFNSAADDKLLLRSNPDPRMESTKRKRNRKKKKNRDVDNHDVVNGAKVVEEEDSPVELNKYTVVESVVYEETVEPAAYVVGELRQRTAIFGGEESGFLEDEKKGEEKEEAAMKIMHESFFGAEVSWKLFYR